MRFSQVIARLPWWQPTISASPFTTRSCECATASRKVLGIEHLRRRQRTPPTIGGRPVQLHHQRSGTANPIKTAGKLESAMHTNHPIDSLICTFAVSDKKILKFLRNFRTPNNRDKYFFERLTAFCMIGINHRLPD